MRAIRITSFAILLVASLNHSQADSKVRDPSHAKRSASRALGSSPVPKAVRGQCPDAYREVPGYRGVCVRIRHGIVQDYYYLPGARFGLKPNIPKGWLSQPPPLPPAPELPPSLIPIPTPSPSPSPSPTHTPNPSPTSPPAPPLPTPPAPGAPPDSSQQGSACKSNPINTLVGYLGQGARTIDRLIETLPEVYRRFFLVAFRSASRQPATPEKPRAVLFGPDAKLVLAFTADSGLEVSAFNDCTGKQEFYEVTETKEGLKLSEENPGGLCSSCHGGNNRHLNWLGYPDWLGFAGAQDDTEAPGGENAKHMASFASRFRNLDRYKHLAGLEKRFEEYGEDIASVSNVPENKVPGSHQGKTVRRRRTLNRGFGVLAMELNNLRIARMLYDQKDVYDKNKYLIASILSDCIPRPKGRYGDQPAVSSLFQEIARKDSRLGDLFSGISYEQNLIYERILFANQKLGLGLRFLEDWKTSFKSAKTDSGKAHQDRHPFDDSVAGRSSQGEPSALYFVSQALGKWDPELKELEQYRCGGFQLHLNDGSGGVINGKDFCPGGHKNTCDAIARKWSRSLGGGQPD